MNPEFWVIIGVGVALIGLQWRLYSSLNISLGARVDALHTHMNTLSTQIHALGERVDRIEARMEHMNDNLTSIKERLSRIEGWIAGRFGEEPVPSA